MKLNIDFIYPVGSIYMSTNDVSPQTLFGGSWSKIEGRFLLGSSSSYPLGSTGGEATHTLTVNEMPNHRHEPIELADAPITAWNSGSEGGYKLDGTYGSIINRSVNNFRTGATGGNSAHNNMPPYQVVNIWKRTA